VNNSRIEASITILNNIRKEANIPKIIVRNHKRFHKVHSPRKRKKMGHNYKYWIHFMHRCKINKNMHKDYMKQCVHVHNTASCGQVGGNVSQTNKTQDSSFIPRKKYMNMVNQIVEHIWKWNMKTSSGQVGGYQIIVRTHAAPERKNRHQWDSCIEIIEIQWIHKERRLRFLLGDISLTFVIRSERTP